MEKITWVEKFGLYDAISRAGYDVVHTQDGTFASDAAAVQAIVDTYDALPVAIASQKTAIDALAAAKRNMIVAGTSPAEMAKWQAKFDQARAFKVNPVDSAAPDIAVEANARGISTADLADKVINKGLQLSMVEAIIAGVAGRHGDAVSCMANWKDVAAYDFTTGWPV